MLLARRGAKVILFDSARFPRRKACAEYVSPGGVALLTSLGVQPHGRLLRGMEIHSPGGACHLIDYCGGQRHGLSIDRLEPRHRPARPGAQQRRGGPRSLPRRHRHHQRRARVTGVQLASGETIQAELVVGADGHNSVVARIQGPPLRTAVAAQTRPGRPLHGRPLARAARPHVGQPPRLRRRRPARQRRPPDGWPGRPAPPHPVRRRPRTTTTQS